MFFVLFKCIIKQSIACKTQKTDYSIDFLHFNNFPQNFYMPNYRFPQNFSIYTAAPRHMVSTPLGHQRPTPPYHTITLKNVLMEGLYFFQVVLSPPFLE